MEPRPAIAASSHDVISAAESPEEQIDQDGLLAPQPMGGRLWCAPIDKTDSTANILAYENWLALRLGLSRLPKETNTHAIGRLFPMARKSSKNKTLADLGRRERQIMEVVYRLEQASVADVLANLSDPPSYSSVRAMLNFLEQKGLLRHKQDKRRYVYYPTLPRDEVKHSALNDLLKTFFEGSPTQVVATLLDSSAGRLSDAELGELADMIEQARKQERQVP